MNVLIWVKNVAVLLLSLLFLIIGVNTLLGSYNLKNPMEFVMYFFSRFFTKKQQNGIDNDETN